MRTLVKTLILLAAAAIIPSAAWAQVTLAGTVKDASGAVLPGVTVEASSPVLIEKTRSAITDATGVYRIESLQPGTYAVTFTLSGFATLKRDAVELSGTGVVKIDADMKVGGVADVILSAVYQDKANIATQLGRPMTAADPITINLLAPGQEYGPRIRQLDFSIKKAVTIWSRRLQPGWTS